MKWEIRNRIELERCMSRFAFQGTKSWEEWGRKLAVWQEEYENSDTFQKNCCIVLCKLVALGGRKLLTRVHLKRYAAERMQICIIDVCTHFLQADETPVSFLPPAINAKRTDKIYDTWSSLHLPQGTLSSRQFGYNDGNYTEQQLVRYSYTVAYSELHLQICWRNMMEVLFRIRANICRHSWNTCVNKN